MQTRVVRMFHPNLMLTLLSKYIPVPKYRRHALHSGDQTGCRFIQNLVPDNIIENVQPLHQMGPRLDKVLLQTFAGLFDLKKEDANAMMFRIVGRNGGGQFRIVFVG